MENNEKKNILYVEDNQDTSDAVKTILENQGFDVTIANCGKDAINIAKNHSFNLFLLDIMLPDMSGWDIYEKLRSKNLPSKFAFLSAIPVSNGRLDQLKKAGVSEYIMKPFSKEELIQKVNKILSS